ncbi:MAG: hypothetical protein V1816_27745, partial [Pseudomonadota bacterium]
MRNAHHLLLFCGLDHGKLETLAGALQAGLLRPPRAWRWTSRDSFPSQGQGRAGAGAPDNPRLFFRRTRLAAVSRPETSCFEG